MRPAPPTVPPATAVPHAGRLPDGTLIASHPDGAFLDIGEGIERTWVKISPDSDRGAPPGPTARDVHRGPVGTGDHARML